MLTINRACISCNKGLHGRTDKKFCNDQCRNAHNNRVNSVENNYVRNIDHRLRRNRRILQNLLAAKQAIKTNLSALSNDGFVFAYCTHTYTSRTGHVYYFCYEFGYMKLSNGRVQIIRKYEPGIARQAVI